MFETKQVLDHIRESTYIRTGLDITRPSQVTIVVTTRCNYHCRMCNIWKSPAEPELSTEGWFRVLDDLGRWPGPGTKLNISGGEPLLRDDLVDILGRASRSGLAAGMVTNGSLLDEPKARALVAAGLFNVNISLDSLDPAVNDRLRGHKGATESAVAAIDMLLEAKTAQRADLAIVLKPIAMAPTLDGLAGLVDFAAQRGIAGVLLQGLVAPFGPVAVHGWRENNDLWPRDPDNVSEVFEHLIALKEKGAPILNSTDHLRSIARYLTDPRATSEGVCRVGSSNLSIAPDGGVPALCDVIRGTKELGNVTGETAESIWNSPQTRSARREIRDCRRNCVLTCQRSRGLAEKAGLYLELRKRSRATSSARATSIT